MVIKTLIFTHLLLLFSQQVKGWYCMGHMTVA